MSSLTHSILSFIRRGKNLVAAQAASESATAAAAAAAAAQAAMFSAETGESEEYAQLALEVQQKATEALNIVHQESERVRKVKESLIEMGVKVELLSSNGNKPIHVMEHLGKFSGESKKNPS